MQRPLSSAWVPMLAAVAGIAITCALGYWQIGRGHDKAALADFRARSKRHDAEECAHEAAS